MSRVHVGVLRGGPSREYEVSLSSGATVLENLPEDKYYAKDILISRDGQWFSRGLPVTPDRALKDLDVVFIALHGEYGEDGTVQKILETYGIPYTGSAAFSSAIAMDKAQTKNQLKEKIPGIKMPAHITLQREEIKDSFQSAAKRIFSQFGPSYIIKPRKGGSSVGIKVVHSIAELPNALSDVFQDVDAVIVEQFIKGREGTCGVIEKMRNEAVYSLPPVEIRLSKNDSGFFDYAAKYEGQTEELCPSNFTQQEKETIQNAARAIHQSLGLKHYSRSDFLVTPSGIYFLEVNTLPGLTPSSLMPKSFSAVGITLPEFLDHLLTIARKK